MGNDVVPPRWYLKNAPENVRSDVQGKIMARRKRGCVESAQPPQQEVEERHLNSDEIKAQIQKDSDDAKRLLSEFGLDNTNMRKNVR